MRTNIRNKAVVMTAIGTIALLLAACSSTASSGGSSAASAGGTVAGTTASGKSQGKICVSVPPQTIGVVDLISSSPIDLLTDQAVEQAATDLGWKYQFVNSNANATTAIQAINTFVSEHVGLIVDTSWDAGPIRSGLLAAQKAHIPVVELAAGNNPSPLFAAMYNENETEMGKIVAQYIVDHVPNARIGDLSTNANYAGVLRQNALVSVVAATNGKAQIVDNIQANLTNPGPQVQAELAAHPNINALYVVFDDMDVAVAAELRTLHKTNVKMYGYFTEASNLALMRSGQIAALGTANLPLGGVVAIDQFLHHLKTGAAFNPNAVAAAGGLHYQVVTTPVVPFNNTQTIAPFLTKWAKEYACK